MIHIIIVQNESIQDDKHVQKTIRSHVKEIINYFITFHPFFYGKKKIRVLLFVSSFESRMIRLQFSESWIDTGMNLYSTQLLLVSIKLFNTTEWNKLLMQYEMRQSGASAGISHEIKIIKRNQCRINDLTNDSDGCFFFPSSNKFSLKCLMNVTDGHFKCLIR